MKILLAVAQLDKRGGKERDCLAIARFLIGRGHDVTIVSTSADPAVSLSLPCSMITVPRTGFANHSSTRNFAHAVAACRKLTKPDVLVAFERIPDSDFYYATDTAIPLRLSKFTELLPRGRTLLKLERELFGPSGPTQVFFLTERQRREYGAFYNIEPSRSIVLPLVLHDDRFTAARDHADRRDTRRQLNLPDDAVVAISIATKPRQKGLDRALNAISAYPNLYLVSVGSVDRWIMRRVQALGIQSRVRVVPYVANIMDVIFAADFLIHPARAEAAGQVIGETLLAGLPAIVSGICGYSNMIQESNAGVVLPEPFNDQDLTDAIAVMIAQLPAMRNAVAAEEPKLTAQRGRWLKVIADEIERFEAANAAA